MDIYDIVQIVGPNPNSSYTPNSRTLIAHFDKLEDAERQCSLFNDKRASDGHHFEVEEHDEESPERAEPAGMQRNPPISNIERKMTAMNNGQHVILSDAELDLMDQCYHDDVRTVYNLDQVGINDKYIGYIGLNNRPANYVQRGQKNGNIIAYGRFPVR